jgi:hypothetical protein
MRAGVPPPLSFAMARGARIASSRVTCLRKPAERSVLRSGFGQVTRARFLGEALGVRAGRLLPSRRRTDA